MPRATKVVTKTAKVSSDMKMTWKQPLYLQLSETSSELRLLLCREKQSDEKRSVNVVTACGIFVTDIIDAAPIDKYFEMFKPGSGKEGGFVRLKISVLTEEETRARQQGDSTQQGGGKFKRLLALTALITTTVLGVRHLRKRE